MKEYSSKTLLLIHISASFLLLILPFSFFYITWYPPRLNTLASGKDIFNIFLLVELGVLVSILALILIGKKKSKKEIFLSSLTFLLLQFSAATLGFKALYEAKPMYIVHEFNRYRVVRTIDIFWGEEKKVYNLFSGPQFKSAKELKSDDPMFLQSIKDSTNGLHPSFKKARLTDYFSAKERIINNSKQLEELPSESYTLIATEIKKSNLDIANITYYPLVSQLSDEWIVLIDKKTAEILTYLNINGWDKG